VIDKGWQTTLFGNRTDTRILWPDLAQMISQAALDDPTWASASSNGVPGWTTG
jgi:hypothetical protein